MRHAIWWAYEGKIVQYQHSTKNNKSHGREERISSTVTYLKHFHVASILSDRFQSPETNLPPLLWRTLWLPPALLATLQATLLHICLFLLTVPSGFVWQWYVEPVTIFATCNVKLVWCYIHCYYCHRWGTIFNNNFQLICHFAKRKKPSETTKNTVMKETDSFFKYGKAQQLASRGQMGQPS